MTAFKARMAELRLRFIDRARRDRHRLDEALAARDFGEVQHISHRLAGLAGTFGFHELSHAAAALDDALDGDTEVASLIDTLLSSLDEMAGAETPAA